MTGKQSSTDGVTVLHVCFLYIQGGFVMRLLVVCLFFCASFAYGHLDGEFTGAGGGTLFDSCNGFRSFTSEAKLTEWA